MSAVSPFSPHQRTCAERNGTSVSCQRRKCRLLCPQSQQGFNGYRIAASVCCSSIVEERARHRKRSASCRTTRTRSRRGRPSEYAVNLGGHDEWFSCSPLIFLVCREIVALPRPKLIFG